MRGAAAARRGRGLLSLAGLGWLALLGCAVCLVMRAAPAVSEHVRVQVLVRGIAAAAPATALDAQEAFNPRSAGAGHRFLALRFDSSTRQSLP